MQRNLVICIECPRHGEFLEGFHPVFERSNPNVVSYLKFDGIHRLATGVCNACKTKIQRRRIVSFDAKSGRYTTEDKPCEPQV